MTSNAPILPTWTSYDPGVHGPWIVAHRGASMHHRESSSEAFEAAIAQGANAVETDVRRTKDGVFVCHHDETLHRTAGIDRAVAELSFEELQRLAPGHAVRLIDVLQRTKGRCNVLLDLKLHGAADIAELVDLLGQQTVGSDVAIGVRSLETQALVSRLKPQLVQLGLLGTPDDAPAFVAAGGRWVRLWERDADRISDISELGVPVLIMVGGDGTDRPTGAIQEERTAYLLSLGADGVMLDDPYVALSRR